MNLAATQLPAHAREDRFQESRMPGNPLVRFDEGGVGHASAVAFSPTLPPLVHQDEAWLI